MKITETPTQPHHQVSERASRPIPVALEDAPLHYISHLQVMRTVERLRAGETLIFHQDKRDAYILLISFALGAIMVGLIVPQLFFFWVLPLWGVFLLYVLLPKSSGQLELAQTGMTVTNGRGHRQRFSWGELKDVRLIKAGGSGSILQFNQQRKKADIIPAHYTGYSSEMMLSIVWVLAHAESNLN